MTDCPRILLKELAICLPMASVDPPGETGRAAGREAHDDLDWFVGVVGCLCDAGACRERGQKHESERGDSLFGTEHVFVSIYLLFD